MKLLLHNGNNIFVLLSALIRNAVIAINLIELIQVSFLALIRLVCTICLNALFGHFRLDYKGLAKA